VKFRTGRIPILGIGSENKNILNRIIILNR